MNKNIIRKAVKRAVSKTINYREYLSEDIYKDDSGYDEEIPTMAETYINSELRAIDKIEQVFLKLNEAHRILSNLESNIFETFDSTTTPLIGIQEYKDFLRSIDIFPVTDEYLDRLSAMQKTFLKWLENRRSDYQQQLAELGK